MTKLSVAVETQVFSVCVSTAEAPALPACQCGFGGCWGVGWGGKDRKARIRRRGKHGGGGGGLSHCKELMRFGKARMTGVEGKWKRSRKAEEEEGPASCRERGEGQAGALQGLPGCLESRFGAHLGTAAGAQSLFRVD